MLYSDKLVFLRNELAKTQKEMADFLNINTGHYGNCERENEIFPLKHLNSICNYFDVSLDYIFSFNLLKQYFVVNKEIDSIKVGERLKLFRKENKITQVKLASILNTTHSVIAGYESGRYLIATPFLYTICKKYNISADYLLGKTDEPKYLN